MDCFEQLDSHQVPQLQKKKNPLYSHGAKNSTRTFLVESFTMLSKLSTVKSTTALSVFFTRPLEPEVVKVSSRSPREEGMMLNPPPSQHVHSHLQPLPLFIPSTTKLTSLGVNKLDNILSLSASVVTVGAPVGRQF